MTTGISMVHEGVHTGSYIRIELLKRKLTIDSVTVICQKENEKNFRESGLSKKWVYGSIMRVVDNTASS